MLLPLNTILMEIRRKRTYWAGRGGKLRKHDRARRARIDGFEDLPTLRIRLELRRRPVCQVHRAAARGELGLRGGGWLGRDFSAPSAGASLEAGGLGCDCGLLQLVAMAEEDSRSMRSLRLSLDRIIKEKECHGRWFRKEERYGSTISPSPPTLAVRNNLTTFATRNPSATRTSWTGRSRSH